MALTPVRAGMEVEFSMLGVVGLGGVLLPARAGTVLKVVEKAVIRRIRLALMRVQVVLVNLVKVTMGGSEEAVVAATAPAAAAAAITAVVAVAMAAIAIRTAMAAAVVGLIL